MNQVFFGDAEKPLPDWRKEPDEPDPDDEELGATPPDVVAMLGFDPLDVARADATWEEGEHPRDEGGKFTAGGASQAPGVSKPKPGSFLYTAKPLPEHVEHKYREEVRQVKALQPEFVAKMRQYHESLQAFKGLKARANSPEGTWEDWEAVQAHKDRHGQITRDMYNMEPPGYFKKVAALRKHDTDLRVIERTVKPVKAETLKIAKQLGFPPEQVKVQYEDRFFTLAGKQRNYAGSADVSQGGKGNITMYARQLIPGKTVAAVAAHEIQHIRYANFQQKRLEQYKEVVREASQHGPMGDTNPIMDWTGVLKPPYDTKYPEWAAWAAQKQEWKNAKVPDAFKGDKLLAASDGVTPYSEEWWDNYHKNPSSSTFESAVHETLAEMMAQEYKTGFLPSHYWSGPLPRHNQSPEYPEGFATHEGIEAVEEEGTKAWRKLYATVNAAAK